MSPEAIVQDARPTVGTACVRVQVASVGTFALTTYVVAIPSVANVTVAFPPATAAAVPDVVWFAVIADAAVATLAVSAGFGVTVKVYGVASVRPVT